MLKQKICFSANTPLIVATSQRYCLNLSSSTSLTLKHKQLSLFRAPIYSYLSLQQSIIIINQANIVNMMEFIRDFQLNHFIVKLGSRSKVCLKSLIRDLDLELEAIIAMSPTTTTTHHPLNFSEQNNIEISSCMN